MSRLKPSFTPAQGERIEALSAALGLRPAQVATRLLLGRLSRVPLSNRVLYQELARPADSLARLLELLGDAPGSPSRLGLLAEEVSSRLAALRRELLGLAEAPPAPRPPEPAVLARSGERVAPRSGGGG